MSDGAALRTEQPRGTEEFDAEQMAVLVEIEEQLTRDAVRQVDRNGSCNLAVGDRSTQSHIGGIDLGVVSQITHATATRRPVSYTHLTLPTTPYV